MEDSKRIELKSFFRTTDIAKFESWILSRTSLKSLFPDRKINNIYFETNNYDSVSDNIDGISKRTKIRLRWYGDSNVENLNGNLEFKRKINTVGWKEKYPVQINNFLFKKYFQIIQQIRGSLPHSRHTEFLTYSQPFILNNYNRKYYSTDDKKVRVTVDSSIAAFDQRWSEALDKNKKVIMPAIVIVEFKFAIEDKNIAIKLMKDFPFRISKHSKYISSVLHA
jgi:SPX domain protein involved in polyphosphate accumulation